jgi:ring-1,2-phenylacetyl-CoA epoxidase subunit PaaE
LENLLQLQVTNILQETPDTKTFQFKSVDNQIINYTAGQFLTLVFDFNGREVRRSYSLSSVPQLDDFLSITVKRVANGEVSRYLHDHVAIGSVLKVLPPTGRFVVPKNKNNKPKHYFFVAAGSGIVPILAQIRQVLATEKKARLTLIYQTSNPKNTIFYEKIERTTEGVSERLSVHYFFSKPNEEHAVPQHLNKDRLQKIVQDTLQLPRSQALFFLCGPDLFMRVTTMALHMLDIQGQQIFREDFVIPVFNEIVELHDFGKPSQALIHFNKKTYEVAVPFRTTILDAALAAGVAFRTVVKVGFVRLVFAK